MAVELESPPARLSKPLKRISRRVLLISIGAHLLFGLGATFFVVSKYVAGRKLTFAAGPKSPNPAERALQHRVQVQQKLQSQNAPPAVPKRVLTTGQAKVQLPPLPTVHVDPVSQAPMMGAAGQNPGFSGASSQVAAGGTGSGSQINFFGIRDKSSSVVVMIDVSGSMFGRTGDYDYDSKKLVRTGKDQNFQIVRDEAIKLIESLGPSVNFGIVRWSGGAYSWKPELVPATEENKKEAIDHVQKAIDYNTARPNKGRPGGTRHDYALEEAFSLKPEVIYMLTDGNATATSEGHLEPIPPEQIFKVVEDGEKTLPKRARIHVIYYLNGKEKADERQMLMNLAARTGGKFNRVEAKGRSQ